MFATASQLDWLLELKCNDKSSTLSDSMVMTTTVITFRRRLIKFETSNCVNSRALPRWFTLDARDIAASRDRGNIPWERLEIRDQIVRISTASGARVQDKRAQLQRSTRRVCGVRGIVEIACYCSSQSAEMTWLFFVVSTIGTPNKPTMFELYLSLSLSLSFFLFLVIIYLFAVQ